MHYRRKAAHTVGGLTGFNTPGCAKSSSCVFSASGARTPGPMQGDHLWFCLLSTSNPSTSVQFREIPNHISLAHVIVGSSGVKKKNWFLHMTGLFVISPSLSLPSARSERLSVFFFPPSLWWQVCVRSPLLAVACVQSFLFVIIRFESRRFFYVHRCLGPCPQISGTNGCIRWPAPLLILKAPQEMSLHFKWCMTW